MATESVRLQYTALEDEAGAKTSATLATIVLNRPEVANAFGPEMIAGISAALANVRHDSKVRALLIAGAGKHFSAGADLNAMQASANLSQSENQRDAEHLSAMFESLASLQIPTIAIVQGASYGGAVGLSACCDIVIASTTSRFALSEVLIGLIPAVIWPYLARKVPAGALGFWALNGMVISATEAQAGMLVQRLSPAEGLEAAAREELNKLLKASPAAQRHLKELRQRVAAHDGQPGLYTAEAIAAIRASAEGQAGLKAFLSKSAAPWIRRLPAEWQLPS